VATTQIYTHVMARPGLGVRSGAAPIRRTQATSDIEQQNVYE